MPKTAGIEVLFHGLFGWAAISSHGSLQSDGPGHRLRLAQSSALVSKSLTVHCLPPPWWACGFEFFSVLSQAKLVIREQSTSSVDQAKSLNSRPGSASELPANIGLPIASDRRLLADNRLVGGLKRMGASRWVEGSGDRETADVNRSDELDKGFDRMDGTDGCSCSSAITAKPLDLSGRFCREVALY